MKPKYELAFMEIAEVFARTSEADRLKVGAVIVKGDQIISQGVNGTYSGWETNVCEDSDGKTSWFTRHAEKAALDKLVRSTSSSEGSVMFITHSPCRMCSLSIKEAGIKKVYYRNAYRESDGVSYLQANGVDVQQI